MSREEREARHAVRTAINSVLDAIKRHGAEAVEAWALDEARDAQGAGDKSRGAVSLGVSGAAHAIGEAIKK